jgi:DNA-binding transcriptional LysR family regulator
MEICQLRYFIAVAEHLNFTAAAEHLYIGQPALSRQILELEKELGVDLFIRDKRSVTLTHAGSFLLNHAYTLINKIDNIAELTRQAGSGLIGSLNIGYMVENVLFSKLFRSFCSEHPDIRLTLDRIKWNTLREALAHCEIDFALTNCMALDSIPGVEWQTLYTDDLMVVVPDNHKFSNKKKISLNCLKDETLLMTSRNLASLSFEHTERLCIKSGFYPKIRSENIWMYSILLMVESGMGITICPKNSFNFPPGVRLIAIDDDEAKLDIGIAWNTSNSNPVIPVFLEKLKSFNKFK